MKSPSSRSGGRGCGQPRGDRGRAPSPAIVLSARLGSKHSGVRTGGRNHHSAASTENNRLQRGAGPRPPYGATTIPPPSTLLQTHRVLGISSSMAAAVAAAPQGPAPCPSLPPKSLRRLWLRKSRPPRLTGGYLAFFFGSDYTKNARPTANNETPIQDGGEPGA